MSYNSLISMQNNREEIEKTALDERITHIERLHAVRTLGRMNDPRSEGALLRALKDEYPAVRHGAISALAGLGGKESEAVLQQLLFSRSPWVRSEAARTLVEISGVPESRPDNLELLFKLLHSEESRIENAILRMGSPALTFLTEKLEAATSAERQLAAQTLAKHIRNTLERIPRGVEPFSWLKEHNITAQAISDLYCFSAIRRGVSIDEVTNTGFDGISRAICGYKKIIFPIKSINFNYVTDTKKEVDYGDLLAQYGAGKPERMGRTILAPVKNGFLALKLSLHPGEEIALSTESKLQGSLLNLPLQSLLPHPLQGTFRVKGLPEHLRMDQEPRDPIAIGYIAGDRYFTYLNDRQLSIEQLHEGLLRCAIDLAELSGCGLIHTSLIALFHKRRDRPCEDTGYCWQKKVAGRIERWMDSCRYPNLRLSGIADLEHIEVFREISPEKLQYHIGGQLLSMSLILASYFRNRGHCDCDALKSILRDCFVEYLRTLSISPPELDEVIDWDRLAAAMAEEMELDRCAAGSEPGQHLGRVHGPFPVPELIRTIHITSAFCVLQIQAGREH
ncbi:MAG: HEAT repeat protein [Methanosaeta sp. PtaU1.Bin112]|nr:MAG: HEAT repeat protein [Methanosaeta sp. PtaU1.Bin112]